MDQPKAKSGYFSVAPNTVMINRPVPYDLFINSSALEGREKYVRIFHKEGVLTAEDVQTFIAKYRLIYVAESERSLFLKSLCNTPNATQVEKTTVLKDSAIHHLQTLFDHELTTEVLGQVITDCRDVVEGMIDVVGDCRVDQLQNLIGNLSFHDFYTYDHSINVSMYCILIYRAVKPHASRVEIVQAGLGGLLHDLGKIRISTEILNSAEKLSPEEFNEIKKHPGFGRELIDQVKGTLPADILPDLVGRIVLEHHENFDGTGYPNKLAGNNIHVLSRVTTIADFFDAITTKRSYHSAMSFDDALALMANSQGKKIDPTLFRYFVEHTQHIQLKKGQATELAPQFDPCQPCRELPLVALTLGSPKKTSNTEDQAHAGVRSEDEEDQSLGKVKLIDAPKPRPASRGQDRAKIYQPHKKKAG